MQVCTTPLLAPLLSSPLPHSQPPPTCRWMFLLYGICPASALSSVVLPCAGQEGCGQAGCTSLADQPTHRTSTAPGMHTWSCCQLWHGSRTKGRPQQPQMAPPTEPEGPMMAVSRPGDALPEMLLSSSRFCLQAGERTTLGWWVRSGTGQGWQAQTGPVGASVKLASCTARSPAARLQPSSLHAVPHPTPPHPLFLSVRVQVRSRHSS